MKGRTSYLLRSAALVCCAQLSAASATDEGANSPVRALAASCAACHGTDGRAVAGSSMPRLAGLPRADFMMQMRAFRDGSRGATVMQQIAKGYSDQQLSALGDYFAAPH